MKIQILTPDGIKPFLPNSPVQGRPRSEVRRRFASDLRLVRNILRETYDRVGHDAATRHADFNGACVDAVGKSYGLNHKGIMNLLDFMHA